MNNLENKEKNLNKLIDKLDTLSFSYSQSSSKSEQIENEKNQLEREKKEVEKKYANLLREHDFIKKKLISLQAEVNKKSNLEEKFNREIDELSQETENLVEEIDKWQM